MSKASLTVHPSIVYVLIFLVATVSVLFYDIHHNIGVNQSLFSFDRAKIFEGEYWRLITGHFLHTNFYHYLMNIIGLVLLYMLHGEYAKPLLFICITMLLCLATSICILWFSSDIHWYVGLSGILHGIFAWGVIIDIKLGRKSGYLLLLGLMIKLIDEQFFSSSTFLSNLIEANVAVDAHLYGAIAGLMLGLFTVLLKKYVKEHV